MLIRAKREAHGEYGSVTRGQIVEVSDYRAQQLIRRGLFTAIEMEALPFEAGRTGPAKQQSSSQADRAQQAPDSNAPEGAPALFASTSPGGLRRGQTRSTPATARGGNTTAASRNSKD